MEGITRLKVGGSCEEMCQRILSLTMKILETKDKEKIIELEKFLWSLYWVHLVNREGFSSTISDIPAALVLKPAEHLVEQFRLVKPESKKLRAISGAKG